MAKKPINLRLDPELLIAADALAASIGTDRTDLVAIGLQREIVHGGTREFVYVLLDEHDAVRYVGRSRNPRLRLRQHLADMRAGTLPDSAKETWLREMTAAGREPRVIVIDDAEPGDPIRELEREWIERLAASCDLTNGMVARARGGVVRGPVQRRSCQRSIRFPDDLAAWIEAEAARLERSFSWVVNRTMTREKDRAESNGRAIEDAQKQALESVLSEAGSGSLDAPPPAKGDPLAASVVGSVIPAASTRTPAPPVRHGVGPKPAAASKPRPKEKKR